MSKKLKKISATALAATLVIPTMGNDFLTISAKENGINTVANQPIANADSKAGLPPVNDGYTYVSSVQSVEQDNNKVTLTLAAGERIRFTFLEDHVFRMYMATPGEEFQEYPTPNSSSHTAKITNKTDDAYYTSYNVNPTVDDGESTVTLSTGKITITIDKETSMMTVTSGDKTVIKETAPLQYKAGSTIQTLATDQDEYFFGGGMQNGRFSHKGEKINIVNENNWVDGAVTSPNPFYWSTNGYGVVRNTWKPGAYDFTDSENITTTHNEKRFDAYFFVDPTAETILSDYYELTGNPTELPEYGAYLGHLNCYNRDYWTKTTENNGIKRGDNWYKESQSDNGGEKETLNGDNDISARSLINDYQKYDMPLGWFAPNDGYGCGYGQEDTQAGNIENLRQFADYAISRGVQTGLWTQSNLWPADPDNPGKDERDIYKEVEAGVHSVKTDVAWVGPGYSFGLNGISVAYDAIASKSGLKPNIVTLDGWAGTQRYGGIWSGDQSGGNWEYIRFHIPTFIGSSLSGQPNNGSDMDGIFGGKNTTIQTREYQWKSFGVSHMLDMDGWGSNQKSPWGLYNDEASINRAYLKLRAQLMPYFNSVSHEATAKGGLPIVRAMFLEEENAYTLGKATQYQYMWGDEFLVAPIYQDTQMDDGGNDIRNDIYLPGNTDIWVDYMTGKQYRGGQVLNGFDAPIWKLPVFVKNGSIIPMYPENNNPEAISETNPKGLDKSQRIVEFYPYGNTEFDAYEDDGKTLGGKGSTTHYTSKVDGTTATLTAEKAIGSYTDMTKERSTEFIVNVSKEPTAVKGNVGGKDVTFTKVNSKEELESAKGNVYFYDESPNVFVTQYADEGSKYADLEDTTTPKLYVKSADKLDITAYNFQVVVEGFENKQDLGSNELNENLAIPQNLHAENVTSSSITPTWDAVEEAASYDIEIDGTLYRNIKGTNYVHSGLRFDTEHTYRVRTVNEKGEFSNWSKLETFKTDLDPFRNTPTPVDTNWEGDYYNNQTEDIAFDHDLGSSHFHSGGGDVGKSLTIDYGKAYQWEKFEYYPRTDAGNGTVTSMDVSTSLDGVHWSEPQNYTWARNADVKTIDLSGITSRFIKLTVKESVGSFFSARELLAYKVDKTNGFIVGDTDSSGSIGEGDLTFYQNYTGLKETDGDWQYIKAKHGDIDGNGIVDAYDLSYVASQLNGGISNPARGVDGKITILPSKTDIKEGDEVLLNVYGIGLKNVNAFSVEFPQDNDLFTIENAGSPTMKTAFMKNFSKPRTHSDMSVDGYTLFTNVGKQDTLNGTGSIATIRIKAKQDFKWEGLGATAAIVVGQDLSVNDAIIDITDVPEAPETEKVLTKQEAPVSFTKKDGSSVTKDELSQMWQQGNWNDILFDGNTAGDMAEFKWDLPTSVDLPEWLELPMDFTFDVTNNGNARHIKEITIYGRQSSNGALQKSKLAYIDANGTKHELNEISGHTPTWTINEDVKQIIWTPTQTGGTTNDEETGSKTNRMLSLHEIKIVEDAAVNATGIAFDETSVSELKVGTLGEVSATVAPNNATNPFYDITSSNPEVVSVTKVPMSDSYKFIVQGITKGEATLTATSEDGQFTATWKVTVSEGLDTKDAEEQMKAVDALYENLYTVESWSKVMAAYEKVQSLIETEGTTQADLDAAVVELITARTDLKFKGSNEEQPSSENLISHDGMTYVDESSFSQAEKEHADRTIDDDPDTIWHSNYYDGYTLPQWFTIDLGANYDLEQVDYLARQGGNNNGHVTHYRIEVSTDNETFVPVVEGYFANDGKSLIEPEKAKEIKFDKVNARYVRFVAIESLGNTKNAYASCAEINFYGIQVANFDELQNAIASAEKLVEEDYTVTSWNAFSEALATAKTITEENTADEINSALNALNAAQSALVKRASEQMLEVLGDKVTAAEALKDDYTTEEFKDVQTAIDAAKALLANPEEAGSLDAVNALVTLSQAISNLPEEPSVDKLREDLEETVKYVKENVLNNTEGLRPGKVQELKDAIAEAEELLANPEATADQLDASLTKVTEKVQELWEIVNKDELNALIETAKAIKAEGYTEESYNALQEAIKVAEKVAVNDDATTTEVKEAINSVAEAIANLEKEVVLDKTALEKEISLVEKIIANIDDYVASTVKGLEDKLNEAKDVLANATTQEEIDEATSMLREARLNARTKADKEALKEAIETAKKYDLSKYTKASAQALRNALSNAEKVMKDEEATQEEVDVTTKAINKAIKNLTLNSNVPGEDGNTSESGNTSDNNQSGNNNTTTGSDTEKAPVKTGVTSQAGTFAGLLAMAGAAAAVLFKKKHDEE